MKFYLINENGANAIDIPNTNEDIDKALNFKDGYGSRNYAHIQVSGFSYLAIVCDMGKPINLPVSAVPQKIAYTTTKDAIPEPFLVGPTLIGLYDESIGFMDLLDNDIERLTHATVDIPHPNIVNTYKKILIID